MIHSSMRSEGPTRISLSRTGTTKRNQFLRRERERRASFRCLAQLGEWRCECGRVDGVDQVKDPQQGDHDADGRAVDQAYQDLGEIDEGANGGLEAGP